MLSKYVTLIAVSATLFVPLVSASIPPPHPDVCISDLVNAKMASPADACAEYDPYTQCAHASGVVYQRDIYTSGATYTTNAVNVGPVHVSSVTVTVDRMYVATVQQRGFTNDFCLTSLLA